MIGTKYILYGALGLAAAGTISYLVRQKSLISSFGYKIVSVTYLGTTNNLAKIEVKMKFTNTADFNIKVNGYKFDVLIDGKVVAKAEDNTAYNIPAKESVTIPFIGNADASLTLSLGLSSIIEHFVDSTPSTATLRGSLSIKAGIVTIKNLPVEVTTTTKELISGLKNA